MESDPVSLDNAFGAEELRQRMLDTQTFKEPQSAWRIVNKATAQGFNALADTEMRTARARKQQMANEANRILLDYYSAKGGAR